MSGSCWLRFAVRIFLNFQRFILMRSHLFSLPSLALFHTLSLSVAFYSNELNEQIWNAIQQLLKLTRFNEICLLINCSRVQLAKRSNQAMAAAATKTRWRSDDLTKQYTWQPGANCRLNNLANTRTTHVFAHYQPAALLSLSIWPALKRCANKERLLNQILRIRHISQSISVNQAIG